MKTTKKQAKKQTLRVNLPLDTLTEAWDKRPDPNMNLDETLEYFFLKGVEVEHDVKICRTCYNIIETQEGKASCPKCGSGAEIDSKDTMVVKNKSTERNKHGTLLV